MPALYLALGALQIPPQTQISYERLHSFSGSSSSSGSLVFTEETSELIDLNTFLNGLMKEEEGEEDDEELQIRTREGFSLTFLIEDGDDMIFRSLPNGGRGIMGRYERLNTDGVIRHIFYLEDSEVFHLIDDMRLSVEDRVSVSDLETVLMNPSYFVDGNFQNLRDLPNNEDVQNIFLIEEELDLQIEATYTRRFRDSAEGIMSSRGHRGEMTQFESIDIRNDSIDGNSLALILFPNFQIMDDDAEVFQVPSLRHLEILFSGQRNVVFRRYNDLSHLLNLLKEYASSRELNYLYLGFHASEASFDMPHLVEVHVISSIQIHESERCVFDYIKENIAPFLNEKTRIILSGCHTGALSVKNTAGSLVDLFSRIFPNNEVSGPICSINVYLEKIYREQLSWMLTVEGIEEGIPIAYRRHYALTSRLSVEREAIEKSFLKHLTNKELSFLFFHPKKRQVVAFERSMVQNLVDSINHFQEYYTRNILNIFLGRVAFDSENRLHVINPDRHLIAFLNINRIDVFQLHQLGEQGHLSQGYLNVMLQNHRLVSSESSQKRKRESDNESPSKKRKE